MPTFTNPRLVHVEPRVKGSAVAAVVVAGAAGFAVVKVLTSPGFAVAVDVAVGVVSALCAAGIVLAARQLRYRTWRPARPVKEIPAPVLVAALPAAGPLAIEAPKPVLTGIIISEPAAAVLAEAGD